MVKLVTRNYWWPEVTNDVKQYMKECNQCQRIKNRIEMPVEKLRLNIMLKKLWQHISVDFIMKLLVSRDHNSILVICDRFLEMLYFIATTEITAEDLVRLSKNNMWKLHELLESVISDREPQFVTELMKKLNKILGIETKLSTAFYSQTDGQMERMNQDVRAESNGLYLFSLLFFISFYFIFLLFSILELKIRVMCDITVSLSHISHSHMITCHNGRA